MKIGIITIHFGTNYGSALQSYALSKYLQKILANENDVHVELINYVPKRYSAFKRYFHLNTKMGIIKRIGYSVICAPSIYLYHKIFTGFLIKYSPLGKEIHNHNELKLCYADYDLLVAGSDQIWNSDYNDGFDSAYFLEFASEYCKKITYAASSGKMDYSENELEKMSKALSSFAGVSVREFQMIEMLNHIGISGVEQVLDPIFLFNKDEWKKQFVTKRTIDEKYLVMYLLEDDTHKMVDTGVQIAKHYGLKTVLISFGHVWNNDPRVDYYLIRKGPEQFVELIMNSDFVITNSFHGIAFSINFNKQFIAFTRGRYNSRLESISRLFGIEDRFYSPNVMIADINRITSDVIDYERVNLALDEYRIKSAEFIRNMVKNTHEN